MEKNLVDIRDDNNQIKRIFNDKDLVSIDDLLNKICELDDEIEHLEEEKRNLEQDIEDNYKPIPVAEQVGISDKDFI